MHTRACMDTYMYSVIYVYDYMRVYLKFMNCISREDRDQGTDVPEMLLDQKPRRLRTKGLGSADVVSSLSGELDLLPFPW